ncbi:hypothetical protein LOTGIDRAFT_159149 [Lottia gigantea]|uniref:EF-hand domain-containing protein n=1 Tax=Lottia gigantea TaxID=225164 RepID=V4AXP1_LOTGI|nr:hypothetical protein LOTGIDRAFT_159149 [Lottia gigantea]ESO98346.1 hypothetical protein LOTGIDRAFT_159149 [Lottia gigantea]
MDGDQDQIVTQAEFDTVIVSVDVNGDGKVPEAEFLMVFHQATGGNHHQAATDKAGHNIFTKGDHDNDGSLTIPELKSIFSAFDYDGNGKATADEFKKFWSSVSKAIFEYFKPYTPF